MQHHRRQPTRLLRPWGSPGKNTEVGCQFPLQCMQVKSESEVVSNSSRPRGLQPTSLLCLCNFAGKSTGVGCHFLLQGIFLIWGLNPVLSHYRQMLYPLSHQESPGAAAVKSLQSCPTLCNTIDGSPPGSPVPGILQARTLEWGAISFSNA